MAFIYDPSKVLEQISPKAKIERLLRGNVTYKRSALAFLNDAKFINKNAVSKVALKTIKGYKSRVQKDDDLEYRIMSNPKQLIQRVQNAVLYQVKEEIKTKYEGESYEWLPSDANEPDPEHQLNYGQIFTIGVGEMPGDRIGCKCGMRILSKDEQLILD